MGAEHILPPLPPHTPCAVFISPAVLSRSHGWLLKGGSNYGMEDTTLTVMGSFPVLFITWNIEGKNIRLNKVEKLMRVFGFYCWSQERFFFYPKYLTLARNSIQLPKTFRGWTSILNFLWTASFRREEKRKQNVEVFVKFCWPKRKRTQGPGWLALFFPFLHDFLVPSLLSHQARSSGTRAVCSEAGRGLSHCGLPGLMGCVQEMRRRKEVGFSCLFLKSSEGKTPGGGSGTLLGNEKSSLVRPQGQRWQEPDESPRSRGLCGLLSAHVGIWAGRLPSSWGRPSVLPVRSHRVPSGVRQPRPGLDGWHSKSNGF